MVCEIPVDSLDKVPTVYDVKIATLYSIWDRKVKNLKLLLGCDEAYVEMAGSIDVPVTLPKYSGPEGIYGPRVQVGTRKQGTITKLPYSGGRGKALELESDTLEVKLEDDQWEGRNGVAVRGISCQVGVKGDLNSREQRRREVEKVLRDFYK